MLSRAVFVFVKDIEMIFQYYDRSGDGRIDYKEFSAMLKDGGA